MPNIKSKEELLRYTFFDDDVPKEELEATRKSYFRSSDKDFIVFLKARGHVIRGVEETGRKIGGRYGRKILHFCFDEESLLRKVMLEYYNMNKHEQYNVNAKCLLEASKDVTSIISNF